MCSKQSAKGAHRLSFGSIGAKPTQRPFRLIGLTPASSTAANSTALPATDTVRDSEWKNAGVTEFFCDPLRGSFIPGFYPPISPFFFLLPFESASSFYIPKLK